ncbi:MAG TPA: SDR family NAD(P)-dependent oxidoreductase, partial [Planctomycetota bacterium]|nr:SDR family NAD(P)-dependent oxidoreductase [Planctomycetota bacterium]
MKMRDLRGKVAIVTGASAGAGWQTAVRLAEAGARVCATARRREALERLRGEIERRGGECLVAPADVTKTDEVERVAGACIERFGRIDVLVNVAGVQIYAPFEEYRWEEIERVFDVNTFGYMRFARAVLPHMRRQGGGHVVNVLSMLSKGAAPLLSSYTASKHALLGWAQALRLELWRTNIDVSGVLLPSVSSCMFDHAGTKLGRQPLPVPPTYDTDVAARAVLRVLRRPDPQYVPVFLQGTLILALNTLAPFVGNTILAYFGRRLQMKSSQPVDRPEGNLFEPVPQGVGPCGSVK